MSKPWKIDRVILRGGRDIPVLTRMDGTGIERYPDAEEIKAACLALNGTVEGIEKLQAERDAAIRHRHDARPPTSVHPSNMTTIIDVLETEAEDLRTTITHLTQERDEARGERDRLLRELGETITQRDAAHAAVRDGFPATVEVIREQRDTAIRQREEAEGLLVKEREMFIHGPNELVTQRIQRDTAEQIAAWLENWEPDYYADEADNRAMSADAVLTIAADRIRAGSWKPDQAAIDAAVKEGT